MKRIIQGALILAGLIHILPVIGVLGGHQLTSMYAIPFTDPNLVILMRHRAVMLGLLGGLALYAAFHPPIQRIGIAAGTVSLGSIVALGWSIGGYNQALSSVILADSIAVVCFVIAGTLSVFEARRR